MIEANAWTMLLSVGLSGLPLALAWLLDRGLRSRAAVRSLRLRAALLASIAVAGLTIVPLRVTRPTWLPAPIAARPSVPHQVPRAAPQLAEPSAAEPLARALEAGSRRAPSDLASPNEAIRALEPPAPAPAPSRKYLPTSSAFAWPRIALGAWLLGAFILLGWSAWCHFHIARVRRRSQVLDEGEAFEEADKIAREWKMKPPSLLRASNIASPFASGVWRASICWPKSMEGQASPASWRAILRHEMAHVRRGDCAWNALAQVARAMLWPQPLLWWTCMAIRKNAEDVCDEAALEGCAPTSYARGLLDLSQRLQGAASTCSAPSQTAGAGALPSQPELSRRVARVLKLHQSDAWRIGWRTRIATLAAVGGVIGASVLATSEDAPSAQEAGASTSSVANTPVAVDLSSPQATLDTFAAAVRAKDARALSQSVQTVNSAEDLEQTARHSLRELPSLSAWRIVAQDGEATATAFMRDSRPGAENGQRVIELRLKKNALGWQVQAEPNRYAYSNSDTLTWAAQIVADPTIKRLNDWAREHGRAIVTGQVLLADGSPASNAQVRLDMDGGVQHRLLESPLGYVMYPVPLSQMLSKNATTDARGFYRVEGLAGVAYSVSALWPVPPPARTRTEMLNQRFDARQIAPEQRVVLREGHPTRAAVLQARAAARLNVLVLDARDGKPVPGASFHSWIPTRQVRSYDMSNQRASGSDGRLSMSVSPGKVNLGLSSYSIDQHGATGTDTSRGKYINQGGSTVQLDDKDPITWRGFTTITAQEGQARRVTVRLMPLSARPEPTPSPAPHLRLPQSGQASGTIIGRVQYEDGRPAPNASVTAVMQRTAQWELLRDAGLALKPGSPGGQAQSDKVSRFFASRARTDASGTFRLEGLVTAPFDISAVDADRSQSEPSSGSAGYTLSARALGVWARDKAVVRRAQPIVLAPDALIRGRITDKATGAGIEGVMVACDGPRSPRPFDGPATTSRKDGTFEMRVAPGRNGVSFPGPAGGTLGRYFRFVDNGQVADTYELVLPGDIFYAASNYEYQVNGGPLQIAGRISPTVILTPRANETQTLEIRLRRLRPSTFNDR